MKEQIIPLRLIKGETIKHKGDVKGIVKLLYDALNKRYAVYGELYEHPKLQCEKSFKFKVVALWKLFWLKRELRNTYG